MLPPFSVFVLRHIYSDRIFVVVGNGKIECYTHHNHFNFVRQLMLLDAIAIKYFTFQLFLKRRKCRCNEKLFGQCIEL